MNTLFTFFETQPRSIVLLICTLLVIGLGIIDYATGPDLSLFIFYLIPVFIATWFTGRWAGVVFSVLSALAWSLADRFSATIIIPFWNLSVEVVFFLIVTNFLSLLKTSLEHEKYLARTDHLTGAVNRRHFMELATLEIERARRYGRPLTLSYVDLDNFKVINDTLGHNMGDTLLKLVVKTMRDHIRTTDIIARLGGDEFVILFPETGLPTAETVADKIQQKLLDAMASHSWPVTFSFGVVCFNTPPGSIDQMITFADKVMYEVKNGGKNRVKFVLYDKQ